MDKINEIDELMNKTTNTKKTVKSLTDVLDKISEDNLEDYLLKVRQNMEVLEDLLEDTQYTTIHLTGQYQIVNLKWIQSNFHFHSTLRSAIDSLKLLKRVPEPKIDYLHSIKEQIAFSKKQIEYMPFSPNQARIVWKN